MKFFGFTFNDKKPTNNASFAPPINDDGALYTGAGASFYSVGMNFDYSYVDEKSLIKKYRSMALNSDVENAIDDIIEDAVIQDDKIEIILDDVDKSVLSEKTKKIIQDEFYDILRLLDWDNNAFEIFKRWYVEARLYYHIIIDEKNTKAGIIELRPIDSTTIKKIKEVNRTVKNGVEVIEEGIEFYSYDRYGNSNAMSGIKISADAIAYVNSGIFSEDRTTVLSHLHKAIKPFNQLQIIEDAAVIYRVTRAPERRAFYIDVGNLPRGKAEAELQATAAEMRSRLSYNSSTGEIKDASKVMSVVEDFFLARRDGNRGTEIQTLAGASNLGEMGDIEYFQEKFLKALRVPITRMQAENGFSLGRASEITRDELKFRKFIDRLRKRFTNLFDQLLYTQLKLKGVVKDSDWKEIKEYIQYRWPEDSYFSELKNIDIERERLQQVGNMENYIGKYFSHSYVRKNVLMQTDDDIKRMDEEIEKEKELYQDTLEGSNE